MRNVVSKVHMGLSWLAVAAIVAQFFFAGLGIFGAGGFGAHKATGYLIAVGSLVVLVLALAGGLGRMRIGFSALLVPLTFIQAVLPKGPPLVAALHPLNALLLLGVAAYLARISTETKSGPRPSGRTAGMTEQPLTGERAV